MKTIDYPTLTVSLAVRDAAAAIDFYRKAFDAEELYRLIDPNDGKIGHAEILISGALVMLADEYPEYNKSPDTLGGSPVRLSLMVKDADGAFKKAVAAGALAQREPADQFYGFRSASVRDPFGHEWMLSQQVEKVSPEEMQRRWNALGDNCD